MLLQLRLLTEDEETKPGKRADLYERKLGYKS